jgi:hypothetical protein
MENFKDNRILLIAPGFHNYISDITSAFESLGASVEAYVEEPSSILHSNFYFSRLQKFTIFQKLYTREIIQNNKIISNHLKGKNFDYAVIIKGECLSDDFLRNLRNSLPATNFILYQWDSLKNFNYLDKIKYFDAVFSFDYEDCSKFQNIKYLPLFYSKEYEKLSTVKVKECKYDLFFLGYNHSIRVPTLLDIIKFCDLKGLKYSVNLMTTISERIQLRKYRNKINCYFNPWKFEDFSDNYLYSKAIIDISSPNQTGLPIRVIEAFGANKKIVTTNHNIMNEDFYDPKLIFLWGKDNPELLVSFLNQNHQRKNIEKYSVSSFVCRLLSLNGHSVLENRLLAQ